MEETSLTRDMRSDDFRLLAYVAYMAQTARSDAARQVFKAYMEQEKKRIQANAVSHNQPVSGSVSVRSQRSSGERK